MAGIDFAAEITEAGFRARQTAHWLGGRSVVALFRLMTSTSISKIAVAKASGVALPAMTEALAFGGIGLSAGARAYMAYQEHEIEEDRLVESYRREIAASLGKSPRSVTTDDLEQAAQVNPVIEEAMIKNDRTRNNHMFSWVASTLLVGAAMMFGGIALLGSFGLAGGGLLFAAIASNIVATQVVKKVLGGIGEKVLGIDGPTVHDKIHDLKLTQQRGHAISQEQVLGVFIQASPDLAMAIEGRFGKPFDALEMGDKIKALASLNDTYHLADITADINAKRIAVGELAYLAVGQHSGVPRLDGKPASLYRQMSESASHAWSKGIEQTRETFLQAKEKASHLKDAYHEGGIKQAWSSLHTDSAPEQAPLLNDSSSAPDSWVGRENARRTASSELLNTL